MAKHRVVIVGGGFAGVKAALELCDNPRFEVTLISKLLYFQYYPSLYHTVTGGVTAESDIPLKTIFEGKNLKIIVDAAESLDRKRRVIKTQHGLKAEYDTLIMALGVVTNYFGIKGLEQYSFGMKSMPEVHELKDHIHQQLQNDQAPDPNYVIVGGGPTGIELAGALPDYLRRVMTKHGLKPRALHIDLVEMAPHLMPRLPKDVGKAIERRLRALGVKLYLGQTVKGETAEKLMVDEQPLQTQTVIWTAGVTNHPFFQKNSFKMTEKGKVVVNQYLQAEDNIYVLGDNADTPYSGMAQTALYDAVFAANNLKRAQEGQAMQAYKAVQPAYVTPVGPHWAALYWRGIRLYGRIGWWLRSAANWLAYHDFEPWWPASKEWFTEFETEEDCPVCNPKPKAPN